MKKTLILGILFLLLIGVIVFFMKRDKAKADAAENYEGNFTVQNVNDIGKIVLSHRAGNTYVLTREGTGWNVNGKYPVRMSSMNPLLDAISQVHIRFIPGDKATPNVMEDIEGTYIHAGIFDRSGNKMKAYRIGGVTPDERGTYMLMDGSKQPFVVHIPSWDGALRSRYALELTDWRDRHFMDFSASEIEEVSVVYPNQKSQSFQISKAGGKYALAPVFPELRDYPTTLRNGTVDAFIAAVSDAACEGYENQYPLQDSIKNMTPFCVMQIQVKDRAEPVELKMWPKGTPVYTPNAPPIHRLFVQKTPGDFMLAQFDVLKGMLRGYDYFAGIESPLLL